MRGRYNRPGRISPAALIVLACVLGGGAWLAMREKAPALPEHPGIEQESFGSGIAIGQTLEAAQAVKLPKESTLKIVYLTQEELASRNLYKEHGTDTDLLAVIHGSNTGAAQLVQGLRCYLGSLEADGERATLGGQFAANLGLDEVKQMYGAPFSETPEQSGRSHLVFYFADAVNEGLAYKLTTSHDYTGKIFSMALEQVLAPQ